MNSADLLSKKGDQMTDNRYEEHFIAFLDILGFKKIIESSEFEDVANIFKAIINGDSKKQLLDNLSVYKRTTNEPEDEKNRIIQNYTDAIEKATIYIMSDSIIIATPALYSESLAVVSDLCHVIQTQLLKMQNPILLRGAIAKGEFYIGKDAYNDSSGSLQNDESNNVLVFGKGLVDAYLAQEKYAVVPRVIVSKNVQEGNKVSLYLNTNLSTDKDDGYDYLPTIGVFLTSAIDEEFANTDNRDVSYYENLYTGTDEYKKLKLLIDTELAAYKDLSIRKKYVWLDNEMNRDKKAYLKSHGIKFMSDATFTDSK